MLGKEKGCLVCRNTGWVPEAYRTGHYCGSCGRGDRLRRRQMLTVIIVAVLIGIGAGMGVIL